MDGTTYCLKYIDTRPVCLPYLENYERDVDPSKEIINVTESEKRVLLRLYNGSKPCWQEV